LLASGSSETGEQSATSSGTNTASRLSSSESKKETSTTPRSGETCESSTESRGVESWILLLRASRVNHSQSPASKPEPMTPETCGPTLGASFTKYDPDTSSWRTSQLCFLTDTSAPFSETWPRAGTISGGTAYQQAPLVPITRGTGCGLLPTPSAQEPGFNPKTRNPVDRNGKTPTHPAQRWYDPKTGRLMQKGLVQVVQMWPTPDAGMGDRGWTTNTKKTRPSGHKKQKTINDAVATHQSGGSLSPLWVEWLMGYPLGWTDLKDLETQSFQLWLQKHGIC